jgi:hypothetical protein
MKLSIIIILTTIMGILLSGRDNRENILQNGSFEESNNGIMPDHWNGDSHIYSLSNQSATGMHSLYYSNSDSSVYKLCSQLLDIKPGMNYTAGIKVKTADITGSDFGASFCVEWHDVNGKWLGGAYPQGIKGTNDWTDISAVISVPDDAVKVLFSCYLRRGMKGKAWFDDAYLKPYSSDKLKTIVLQPSYRGLLFKDDDNNIVLSVDLKDNNLNSDSAFLSAGINDLNGNKLIGKITNVSRNKNDYLITLNSADLDTGRYKVSVSLEGTTGLPVLTWNGDIHKINRDIQPLVYFDDRRRLIVNNKMIFPLGMYWSTITEEDLKVYAESKFNFILPYSRPTYEQMRLADKYKLKVVYSVKDFYTGSQYVPAGINTPADEITILKTTLEQFKDNPALLAWYNNDEFPPEYADRLNQHYKIIRDYDPNHPVLSIIVKPGQADLYLSSTDIIGSDPYVIPKSQLYKVGEATADVRKADESRPVWMVIQAHNIGNYLKFPDQGGYRSPSYDEMRSMSWQAICEGADGLIYYSYFDLKRNPDIPFAVQWENLKRITAEIDTVSGILLSDENKDTVNLISSGNNHSWYSWTSRNYKNKLYIFVVNNGKGEGEIKCTVPGKYKSVQIINDPTKHLTLSGSQFTDTIKNLEVKIYELE